MFLDNMSLAFDKSTVVKEYKEKIETLKNPMIVLLKKLETLRLKRTFSWTRCPLRVKAQKLGSQIYITYFSF